MTPQSTFMIVDEIREGRREALEALLAGMCREPGIADPDDALLPFARFATLHVARFVVIDAPTAGEIAEHGVEPEPWAPRLAFLGDVDGGHDDFFEELVEKASEGLARIFSHCVRFTAHGTTLLEWLKANDVGPKANYVNHVGRTVRQAREEAALARALAAFVDDPANGIGAESLDAREAWALRARLLDHVELERHHGRLTLTPEAPTPLRWRLRESAHLAGVPLALLLLSPLVLLGAPFYLLLLRLHERLDPDIVVRPDPAHVARLAALEDRDVTNHFNVFGDVKPGRFRLWTLKALLLLLDYAARHVYARGRLTRIRTIHFARWVLMDRDRRLFFASNYDGSLESYMDDFVNKVAWGLNLVFSNGVGYPPTRWLIKGGAEHEQRYKYTLRRHQLPSALWYKAYPGLTAHDLARNAALRAGVEERPESDAALRRWLALI